MLNKVFILMAGGILFALSGASLLGQEDAKTDENVLSIIQLSESKIYSPIREGLSDIQFTQQVAYKQRIRTFWFNAPDQVKAILGTPVPEKKITSKDILNDAVPLEVEMPVARITAIRTLSWIIGNPISCLLPFGTFSIIKKDENGTQLRFKGNEADLDNYIWSYIDFHLDPDFRIIKIMEKTVPMQGEQVDEHTVTMKPLMEGSDLLIMDTDKVLGNSSNWQQRLICTYHYGQFGSYWLPEKIEMEIVGKDKTIVERYLNYRIDEGIEDSVFDSK